MSPFLSLKHIGDVLDDVFKKDVLGDANDFWSINLDYGPSSGNNAYAHFVNHVLENKSQIPGGEFPDIKDAVTYVKTAREFLEGAATDSDVVTWIDGKGDRLVFNKVKNWFAVEKGANHSRVPKTFFHPNFSVKTPQGTIVDRVAWLAVRGYHGPL